MCTIHMHAEHTLSHRILSSICHTVTHTLNSLDPRPFWPFLARSRGQKGLGFRLHPKVVYSLWRVTFCCMHT